MRVVQRCVAGVVLLGSVIGAAPLGAQRLGPEPKARRGTFAADSNDAIAIYNNGLQLIDRDPQKAADAFYWAARLNPTYADPLYGRYAALLLKDQGLLRRWLQRNDRAPAKDMRQLDSLVLRALTINPFLFRRFDKSIFNAAIRAEISRSANATQVNGAELDFAIQGYLNSGGAGVQGWMAYNEGRLTDALTLLATAEKGTKRKANLRIDRGRIFGQRGEADSAIAQFQAALTEMRTRDEKEFVILYNSKAMLEHSIGTLLEGRDDVAGARDAYGRALQEDLAFYPAHVRNGLLSLGRSDTATALNELELAAQVAADDPYVHYTYGYVLAYSQRFDQALDELNRAATLEPLYAMPHAMIARIWEVKHDATKAAHALERFLSLASQRDPQRPAMQAKLAEMKEFLKPDN